MIDGLNYHGSKISRRHRSEDHQSCMFTSRPGLLQVSNFIVDYLSFLRTSPPKPVNSLDPEMSSTQQDISIRQVTTEEDVAIVRSLWEAYTTWLGVDVSFQNYASDLASLPGYYSPAKGGALLLARKVPSSSSSSLQGSDGAVDHRGEDDNVLGVIALRQINISPSYASPRRPPGWKTCEIKRLYVPPTARRMGVARKLVLEVLQLAEDLGYDEILLDSLKKMVNAAKLYGSLGFVRTEAYYPSPLEDTIYYSKALAKNG